MKFKNDKIKELELIIEDYQNDLFSFAFYRLASYDLAQDIVQDVFLKYFEDSKKLSEINNIKTYLFKSVSNACVDYQRKYGKIIIQNIENHVNTIKNEEEKECLHEYFRIEEILNHLPEEQAEILKLKFVDDLSFVEIADILNENVNTVKSRYKYAIEKLKKLNLININVYE